MFRGDPFPGVQPVLQSADYWVLVNSNALPRVFIPRHVEIARDHQSRLQQLAAPKFNPREVAYVESPVDLPAECRGSANIVDEIPTRVKVAVNMQTPGLVVLSDLWDTGWRAYLNGESAPILRANHAIRVVVVPAGTASLEFSYEPASFTLGLGLAVFAISVLLLGTLLNYWRWRIANRTARPALEA